MFAIKLKSSNKLIGFVDKPYYIYYDSDSKMNFPAPTKEVANGIAFDGIAYNINEDMIIPNTELIYLKEVDSGEYVFSHHNQIVKNSSDINSMEQIILSQDNSISMMEEAIMELDNNQAVDEGGES